METKNKTHSSELRQDLITGDWVVIATGRAKRPEDFVKNSRIISENNVSEWLFCDPEK